MKLISILALSSAFGITTLALAIALDQYTPALFSVLSAVLVLLVVAGDYSKRNSTSEPNAGRPLAFSAQERPADQRRAA